MKSKTSSCKGTALRKNLTRFFPLWAGYILFLLVMQIALQGGYPLSGKDSYWYVSNAAESIVFMGFANFVYGFLCAQLLLGDLFQRRMCFGLHSLPMRRERWFSTHIVSGFLFSLVPNAAVTGIMELMLLYSSQAAWGWQIPLFWFAGSTLQFTFFFGLAVFCAMCVGSRFAMTVVYGMVNGASALAYLLAYQIYVPLLYGVVPQSAVFELLTPLVQIMATRFLDCQRLTVGNGSLDSFTVHWESWMYLTAIAGVGILLLIIARQMYKMRKLERCGDFLAVPWLEPVFQIVFTVLSVSVFHGIFALYFTAGAGQSIAVSVIGLVVGWFAGRMLLERSVRVFRFRNFAGLAVAAVLLAASLYAVKLDPMNITGRIPAQEQVKSVSLTMGHRGTFTTEDPGEIEDILQLHTLALEDRIEVHPDYSDDFYHTAEGIPAAANVFLNYRLENGGFLTREYYILTTGEAGRIAKQYCSRVEVAVPHADIDNAGDFLHEMQDIHYISVSGERLGEEYITPEFLQTLAQAILADCESGAMVQTGAYHPDVIFRGGTDTGDVRKLYLDMSGAEFFCYLDIYADCTHTLAVLESTGIMDQVRDAYR